MLKSKYCFPVVLLLAISARAAEMPRSLFPSVEQIDSLRADARWGGLHSACEAGLKLESHPVADFSPPPHYGASGPVVAKADAPVPTLRRESLAVYRLALCFEISKDARYSAKAEQILNGWAHTTTRIGTLQGADGFNFYFPYALMGASLLQHDAGWRSDDFSAFVRKIVIPANNADKPNNHGNWGVLLLATAGGYLNDPMLLDQARQRWQELMRSQVAQDGSLPLEVCRSDTSNWCGGETKGIKGIAYTHYTLYPTTIAAEIFRNAGKDVYSTPEGALLCKAYSRAASWTLHPETFPYYASNKGKLDGMHNVDYFYILQQRCPVGDGAAVLKDFGASAADPMELRAIYGR